MVVGIDTSYFFNNLFSKSYSDEDKSKQQSFMIKKGDLVQF